METILRDDFMVKFVSLSLRQGLVFVEETVSLEKEAEWPIRIEN